MITLNTVNIIGECKGFQNPVLILKKAQEHILVGRQLDVVDPSTELKGKTNFVIVDRDNLFQDALAEISLIDNLRLPLELNFMGEGAQDKMEQNSRYVMQQFHKTHKVFEETAYSSSNGARAQEGNNRVHFGQTLRVQ